ncbi:TGF-beta family member glass bottom boat [Arctopsyche grandis]|uniref:TGF-beta family member glass bottom boat n=1 Tax=Arctopsyche grandis TaxID=121162 RepID=UPI00406D7E87
MTANGFAAACCLLALALVLVHGSLSGVYVDNGMDQTVLQRSMSSRERHVLEQEMLELLGLGDRPRRRAVPLNRSAPIFLLDAYKTLSSSGERAPRSPVSSLLSRDDLHDIDQSDVIITFQSKNHHGTGMRHERGRKLWFDVSEVPVGENIFNAELRIYQSVNYSTYDPEDVFTISAHKIVSVDHKGGLDLELVGSKNTSAVEEGWIEINVTSAFIEWVAFPSKNNGLYLSVHLLSKPGHDVKPEEIGLVNTKGEDEQQPFMVAFLKSTGSSDRIVSRQKRQTGRNKKMYGASESYSRNPLIEPSPSHWNSRSCQIQTLYVSFMDLKWQDWIIAPDGYSAYYCSGECNFPLNAHMNATNHAIVQTLVHLLNPTLVPKPCCAPTKLTAVTVLYFLDDSNVILKKYKNMVVKSCGCH